MLTAVLGLRMGTVTIVTATRAIAGGMLSSEAPIPTKAQGASGAVFCLSGCLRTVPSASIHAGASAEHDRGTVLHGGHETGRHQQPREQHKRQQPGDQASARCGAGISADHARRHVRALGDRAPLEKCLFRRDVAQ
ncbi:MULTISPECIES: hypothetical protein [unclassified Sphingobium]|uniref:hypothetical protein n=1 Tax=unclassified Sphingobium TaxID=2611147 RepID=UPI0022258532|nr:MULTISPECIES: hypothetical protein [unclassified Sphingobium]MCW2410969.1 hypothetical protein [Sphingobium sp. B8D3D]MCW2416740.1 hypothetical protein [Sphingobium sp. B8D3A]